MLHLIQIFLTWYFFLIFPWALNWCKLCKYSLGLPNSAGDVHQSRLSSHVLELIHLLDDLIVHHQLLVAPIDPYFYCFFKIYFEANFWDVIMEVPFISASLQNRCLSTLFISLHCNLLSLYDTPFITQSSTMINSISESKQPCLTPVPIPNSLDSLPSWINGHCNSYKFPLWALQMY